MRSLNVLANDIIHQNLILYRRPLLHWTGTDFHFKVLYRPDPTHNMCTLNLIDYINLDFQLCCARFANNVIICMSRHVQLQFLSQTAKNKIAAAQKVFVAHSHWWTQAIIIDYQKMNDTRLDQRKTQNKNKLEWKLIVMFCNVLPAPYVS